MEIVDVESIVKEPFNKRKFEGVFPELIKKLINKCDYIEYNRFPSGDKVNSPGLDGMVINNRENKFIPIGQSFWELGTENTISKINKDYEKRLTEITEEIRKQTVFILVMGRTWHFDKTIKQVDWINDRKKDWKDVRIIDAPIINDWLEENIDVALWLLNQFNLTQGKLKCNFIDKELSEILNSTNPNLTTNIFTEGREENEKNLIDFLENEDILYIKSESRFDSMGFLLSVLSKIEDEKIKDRILIVNNKETLEYIDSNNENIILILNFDDLNDIHKKNNKFIIPICKYDASTKGIELNLRGKRKMSKLISNLGIDTERAHEINVLSNGNMLLIRRLLAKNTIEQVPKWFLLDDKESLIPILFLQNFEIDNPAHLQIGEFILEESSKIFLKKWLKFEQLEEPMFKRIYNTNQLLNVEDAWYLLKEYITDTEYKKICELIDFSLFGNKTSKIEFLEKSNIKNSDIENLLYSLAHYAICDRDGENQKKVDLFINNLMNKVNVNNFDLIIKNISILAECSPEIIIDFIEKDIKKENSVVIKCIQTDVYTNILYTLEYLVSLQKTKFRAIKVLYKIAKMDINYAYSNTPEEALTCILNPYFNRSSFTLDEKKAIIKKNLYDEYDFTNIYLKILKKDMYGYGVSYKVRKQEFNEEEITYEKISFFYNELNKDVIEIILSKNNFFGIEKIISNYYYFSNAHLKSVLTYICEKKERMDDELLYKIYQTAVHELASIIKYGESDFWSKRIVYKDILRKIINASKPREYFLHYKYMFDSYYFDDFDIQEDLNDIDDEDSRFEKLRNKAIEELEKFYGKGVIKMFALHLNDNYFWGSYLAKKFKSLDDLKIIIKECLSTSKFQLLGGYISNYEDSENSILCLQKINVDCLKRIIPFLDNWKLEMLCKDEEDKKMFFQNKSYGINEKFNEELFNKFLKYNPAGCLDYFHNKIIDEETYKLALITLGVVKKEAKSLVKRNYKWHIKQLLENLEKYKYSEDLATVELEFLNCFDGYYPQTLVQYWFENPKKFIEYIVGEYIENGRFDVLFSLEYKFSLGLNEFNKTELFKLFCDELTRKNENNLELEDVLICILGNILGRSPIGTDGVFPHENARKILELNNEKINRNFLMGFFNSIGARIIGDGTDEFEKEKKFIRDAATIEIDFPVTAQLLKKIALHFNASGKEDKKQDLLGW